MIDTYFSPLIVGAMRWGAWGAAFSSKQYEYIIDHCVDLGLFDFDHADIYGGYSTEAEFGAVIKRRPDLKSKLRVTTKCGIKMPCSKKPGYTVKSYDSGPAHIMKSVDQSLINLGVEKIDLLLLHRPDYLMDVAAIADCFQQLQSAGKVKHFGVSNFNVHQLELLRNEFPLVMHQMEISLGELKAFHDGTVEQCQLSGIQISAWSPLAGGLFFKPSKSDNLIKTQALLKKMSSKYNASVMQLLLAWLNRHPSGIIPVLGTSQKERITESLKAMEIQLSKEDWYALLQASMGEEIA